MRFSRVEHVGGLLLPVVYQCTVMSCDKKDKRCISCDKCLVTITAADWHRVKKEIEYDAGKND